MTKSLELVDMTAEIVAAYVGNNPIAPADLPGVIKDVYAALDTASVGTPEPEPLNPAVPIKKSITPDYIVCLEDGKRFKSLKRHLNTHYGLSPDEYRAKWGLPSDYPMVAPNYAKARSNLAKEMGLGRKRAAAKRGRKPAKS